MKKAPLPANEEDRIARLQSYDILDTLDEQKYDDILQLVTQICGTSMANISFVDRDRQWFKAVVGLEDRETARDVAFCAHTILDDEPLIVPDATQDKRFHDNPLVTDNPGIRFYAGTPLITPDGYRIGSLCALDTEPRALTEEQRAALRVLANHVVDLLELRRRTRTLEELSAFKSRMLAVVAHDLRSPVASLSSLLTVLSDPGLSENEQQEIMGELIAKLKTADYLIDNIVGWAASSLSEPHTQSTDATGRAKSHHANREPIALADLFKEIESQAHDDLQRKKNRLETVQGNLSTFRADRNTLLFILRNLVANANKFTSDGVIRLSAHQREHSYEIRVTDSGVGMTQDQIDNLFDWQVRRSHQGTHGEQGAGLALLLCQDMARRMDGEITVVSEVGTGSTFTLTLKQV